MPYIGNTAANRFVASKAATQFSGDGSTTAFTLDHAVGSDEDILVSVDGVIQEPSVAYAVSSGTTLTFTAAPSSNSGNNIFVYYLFRTVGTLSHPSSNALEATSGTFTGAFTSLGIDDNADATAITITSDENVGVGTTSPTSFGGTNLHVNHATTYASALWTSNARSMQVLCSDANGVQSMGTRSNHPLDITTNDNAKIKITANGEVTMPSQPAFSAQPTSDINNITGDATTAALTNVAYTEYFDVNADFNHNDGANRGKFTAPVTGKYYIGYTLCYSGVTSASTSGVHALVTSNRTYNNNFNPYNHANVGVNGNIVFSAIVDMDANDTTHVTLYVNGNGSKVVDILASQHKFFGMLIG